MSPVREWHVAQLAAVWLATPVVFFAMRWGVHALVYQAELDGRRVVITSGLWSSGFASAVTVGVGVLCALVLVAVTVAWLAGRRHRRRMAAMIESDDRRPLM